MPSTFFLKSPNVEGIYARWAKELRPINIRIIYIEGKRNKVVDALSRTILTSNDYTDEFPEYCHVDQITGEWI
ncbi:hypothetical protein RRF57_009852 [Xylaria bambusicola]|uniref:Uncharacterized protein n=1 Tax=Xylaria bambusicola TaxID=326684 RepID=A0AAN7URA3_9PEZI